MCAQDTHTHTQLAHTCTHLVCCWYAGFFVYNGLGNNKGYRLSSIEVKEVKDIWKVLEAKDSECVLV